MIAILLQLQQLEKQWATAIVGNDAAEIGKFVTDDRVLVGADGRLIDRTRFDGTGPLSG